MNGCFNLPRMLNVRELKDLNPSLFQSMKQVYSDKIGYEFFHVETQKEREWFIERVEDPSSREDKLLDRENIGKILTQSEVSFNLFDF